MAPRPADLDPHFTVFIRLPFPRGDFVDPPAVCPPEGEYALFGLFLTLACRWNGVLLKTMPYGISYHDRRKAMILTVRNFLAINLFFSFIQLTLWLSTGKALYAYLGVLVAIG